MGQYSRTLTFQNNLKNRIIGCEVDNIKDCFVALIGIIGKNVIMMRLDRVLIFNIYFTKRVYNKNPGCKNKVNNLPFK